MKITNPSKDPDTVLGLAPGTLAAARTALLAHLAANKDKETVDIPNPAAIHASFADPRVLNHTLGAIGAQEVP